MKAVLIKQPGGVEQLLFGEVPTPKPQKDEILVKVKATACNRADILQRKGKYPPPLGASPILGLEMAGIIEEVGEKCRSDWKVGDRVFGLLPGGGYAEYVTIPGTLAMPIPDSLSFEQAAAIPEVYLTAFQALFWVGRLQRKEKVLIHAGASGVGTAAIQLVKQNGSKAIVTTGSETKCRACLKLGASHAFNYKKEPFSKRVLQVTEGKGVDLILDFVGAAHWEQNIDVLQVDGRLVLISTLGGAKVPTFNLAKIISKRLQITGTTLRTRDHAYKAELTHQFSSYALPLFQTGELKPVIDRIFSWEHVKEAHQYMEQNKNIGKLILRMT
ncbi:NAD(P)H-quinone oxidoreductase [Hazenella coriacea]|uniref:Putative PIG3 family NAD(P)H quinone oxidoreductase n=1 Tax=Hazenella coriacea TaxID=1179467 RepID=A0A4R3LCM7_9BACL|nr:NAD(P)H-quinone oxidoreductase [Hazenella coriacea]TCS97035.1 putative PIG3 family NAD(P)H quinone oxidoreductase [Hazenella coriacea]